MSAHRQCCAHCFGDRGLAKIFPSRSAGIGACGYCETTGTELAEPSALADIFSVVLNIYNEAAEGHDLVQWLRDDWAVFSHP